MCSRSKGSDVDQVWARVLCPRAPPSRERGLRRHEGAGMERAGGDAGVTPPPSQRWKRARGLGEKAKPGWLQRRLPERQVTGPRAAAGKDRSVLEGAGGTAGSSHPPPRDRRVPAPCGRDAAESREGCRASSGRGQNRCSHVAELRPQPCAPGRRVEDSSRDRPDGPGKRPSMSPWCLPGRSRRPPEGCGPGRGDWRARRGLPCGRHSRLWFCPRAWEGLAGETSVPGRRQARYGAAGAGVRCLAPGEQGCTLRTEGSPQ